MILQNIKKEHIKKTAATLFAESGYHSTSIISISQQAGISKGLVFSLFIGLALNFVTDRLTIKSLQEIFTLSILTKLN